MKDKYRITIIPDNIQSTLPWLTSFVVEHWRDEHKPMPIHGNRLITIERGDKIIQCMGYKLKL